MPTDVITALCAVRPKHEHPVLRLLLEHGVSDVLAALREYVANAIDATRAAPPDASSLVEVVCEADALSVRDCGTGVAGDMFDLLCSPARSTKQGRAGQIGRMGVGFLAALASVRWILVVTSTHPRPLALGPVPAHIAARRLPVGRSGTLVAFAPHAQIPDARDLADHLRQQFPFVPVPLRLRDERRPGSNIDLPPQANAWSGDAGWQSCLRESLGLPAAVWTVACRLESCRVVTWMLSLPDPTLGGRAVVFQQGARMLPTFEWGAVADRLCPPWLHLLVDTDAVKPLLSRTGIAAGPACEQLIAELRAHCTDLIDRPSEELIRAIPRFQHGFGEPLTRWLAALNEGHPLRLASAWPLADGTSRSLGELTRSRAPIRIIVGGTRLADILFEDLRHRADPGFVHVRARNDVEATVLCDTLRRFRRAAEEVDFAGQGPTRPVLTPEPGVARILDALRARLAPVGVAIIPVRLGSPDTIGIAEAVAVADPDQSSYLRELRDLQPAAVRQQATLFLNEASRVAESLARRGPAAITEGGSLLLVGAAMAQSVLPNAATAILEQALDAAMTGLLPPPRRHARHARVFLIAPFAETDLLAALREVLEEAPWFVEVERADDSLDATTVLEHVTSRIDQADACVVDLRGARPNIMLELGYVLGRFPLRRCVLICEPKELMSDMGGHMVLAPPNRGVPWSAHLAARLPAMGLTPQALPADEPFLHARHLRPSLRARAAGLDLRALAFGPGTVAADLRDIRGELRVRVEQFAARNTFDIAKKP